MREDAAPKIDTARLRELREAAGLTQADVAELLGYKTRIGYVYLETGRCSMSAAQAAVLARRYGVPIESLFCRPDSTVTETAMSGQTATISA